ncbi:hypothetical protein [Agrobacterium tumefaciens]|uniref:hypothetical protein n=2 Tax=Rhizobiaceae TaxID=82115 RepID=UPI0012E39FD7|nr:hypothetical protein [Agrobacterium tumefaciens]NSY59253.1 hypothetical protein [Agrobacterium tumefaciens]NTZ60825.1 hypothetical protein [Agrobacterium tumefaciens]UXR91877.1 hypothetical protein FY157_09440 [Agrobacterium tumefaciens]
MRSLRKKRQKSGKAPKPASSHAMNFAKLVLLELIRVAMKEEIWPFIKILFDIHGS